MKFRYEYRTSDNVRHEGTINAASRDSAFMALRERGIRPSSVVDAPGFFNKLFGRYKRWIAIVVLAIIAAVSIAVACRRTQKSAPFVPSAAFERLEKDAEAIMATARRDSEAARLAIRELFRERYPLLSHDQRERQEAQSLYGLLILRIEAILD